MIASVATTAGLSAQRSAEGLSPRRGGRWYGFYSKNTPSAPLRYARPPNLRGQFPKKSLYRTHVNIDVVHKCFLLALSVILTKRSVGRISRRDLARDVCEMFHFVQHDKLCFGQQLYYSQF